MSDIFSRAFWIWAIVFLIVYGIYVETGLTLNATTPARAPIVVRDVLGTGSHFLSGIVTVSSSCDQLALKVRQSNSSEFSLIFSTWQEPSIPCVVSPTPRVFRTTVFAPSSGVHFVATLDDETLPLAVFPMPKIN